MDAPFEMSSFDLMTKTDIGRRQFIGGIAAAAGTLWLPGCDETSSGASRDALPHSSDLGSLDRSRVVDIGPDQGMIALDDAGRRDLAPTCGDITESNIEGPFFTPDSPLRRSLREEGMKGAPLVIEGRVLDTSCRPLAGALLDFWQADADGAYDNAGFTLRGHQLTDTSGRYRLETIIPGHYLNGAQYRPAHIHVKAAAEETALLTTQLYFEGDPYNAIDPWILPSLIMSLQDSPSGEKLARFDFVLPRG